MAQFDLYYRIYVNLCCSDRVIVFEVNDPEGTIDGMSPAPKLYEQVAEKIKIQIENGVFNPGQKVPSVRVFSRQLKVSVFTVIQAYWALENQGYLESHPKSGFYVPSSRQLLPREPNHEEISSIPKPASSKSLT